MPLLTNAPTSNRHYDAYHQALEAASCKVRRNWSAGLLLDIHGQGAQADTIFRGTDNGKSVSALEQRFGRAAMIGPKSILGQLAAKGYRIEPGNTANDRERRYSGGYTTRTYGSHRGSRIDAIQLELGANLRSRGNLERTASDLAEAIEIFAKAYLPLSEIRPRESAVTSRRNGCRQRNLRSPHSCQGAWPSLNDLRHPEALDGLELALFFGQNSHARIRLVLRMLIGTFSF